MMIGSSSKQSLHLSISNSYQSINDNNPKFKKENVTEKNVNNSLKKNDPLKNLMEQKQKIADSRQKYLDDALSRNESADSIKQNLAEYDNQVSEIDKQLSELKLEEQKKKIGTDDKDKKNDKEKDSSDNTEIQGNTNSDNNSEMMSNLVSLSNNMSAAKTLSAEKASASGEKRVLDCEIKIDESRGLNPIGKKNRVAKLKDNIEKIEQNIGDKLNTNISDDNSNNAVNKNENSKIENSAKPVDLSTNNSKLLLTIKKYKENSEEKTQTNGQKINSVA